MGRRVGHSPVSTISKMGSGLRAGGPLPFLRCYPRLATHASALPERDLDVGLADATVAVAVKPGLESPPLARTPSRQGGTSRAVRFRPGIAAPVRPTIAVGPQIALLRCRTRRRTNLIAPTTIPRFTPRSVNHPSSRFDDIPCGRTVRVDRLSLTIARRPTIVTSQRHDAMTDSRRLA